MIFPADVARATVVRLGDVYARLGAPDGSLVHGVFEGDHCWYGTDVPAFLERWL
jgi:hypothetical protein